MGNSLNYAKEIYYHFRDEHGESKVVPVRGVYVTGEFKPPAYFEPILRLVEVKTKPPLIEDYIETNLTHLSSTTHHLYDISINSAFTFDTYTQSSIPNQLHTTTHHLYDISIDPSFYTEDFWQESIPNQMHSTTHHLYDMNANTNYTYENYTSGQYGSQPEPLLRMIELNVNTSTVEDL